MDTNTFPAVSPIITIYTHSIKTTTAVKFP